MRDVQGSAKSRLMTDASWAGQLSGHEGEGGWRQGKGREWAEGRNSCPA